MLLEAQEAETQADLVTHQARYHPREPAGWLYLPVSRPSGHAISQAAVISSKHGFLRGRTLLPHSGTQLSEGTCTWQTWSGWLGSHDMILMSVWGAIGRGGTGGADHRRAAACGAGAA